MPRLPAGLIAGLVATVIVSALMLIQASVGVLPEANAIGVLSSIASQLRGDAPSPSVGWAAHFLVGTVVWGGLFAVLVSPRTVGASTASGVLFAVGAWLLMMVVLMPAAGFGLFGGALATGAALELLETHVIYGAVLGATYFLCAGRTERSRARYPHEGVVRGH